MIWINEIESAKSIADLKTTYAITGAKLQTNFDVLDSKIAIGLKKVINADFNRRVFIQEEAAQKEKRIFLGRQVAWMIYEYFKVSDTNESVLDLDEILKVELENDNLQPFNTRWDETIIVMKKQPDEEILDNLNYCELSTVRKAKAMVVSVHSRYCSKR